MIPSDYALVVRAGIFGQNYPITEIKYDANGNAEYTGIAPRGSATSAAAWIVEKRTFELITVGASSWYVMTKTRVSPPNSVMDDYATLSYA